MARDPGEKRIPGTPPDGWGRLQFYAPESLFKEWARVKEELPGKSHKLMCTGAIALFIGLPPEVQAELYEWAHRNELKPGTIDPVEAANLVRGKPNSDTSNVAAVGSMRRMPVVPVNGPTPSETSAALIDRLKRGPDEPPLPNAATHRVSRIEGPDPKRGKGAA